MEAHDLLESFDPAVWAREFVECAKKNPAIAIDENTMTGWFANAFACQERHGAQQTCCKVSHPAIALAQMLKDAPMIGFHR